MRKITSALNVGISGLADLLT